MDSCGYAASCPPPPPPPPPYHHLPFTGFDVWFFLLLGLAIIVTGAILRLGRR